MFSVKSILYCSHNSVCHLSRFDLNNALSHTQYQTTEIFKPQLFSSHATCLYTFFLNSVACSVLPFISQTKQPNECIRGRMSLPSRNLYKCKQVAFNVVVACLLVYPLFLYCIFLLPVYFLFPFYTDVVGIYFFIHHVNKPIIFVF